MNDRPQSTQSTETFLLWTFLAVFFTLLIRTAWLCDDAYITFRVADNALAGHGLRWNVAERVQAYTHPLWMFLVTGAYAVTRDVYYTSLALSLLLSAGTMLVLTRRIAVTVPHALLVAAAACFSKAFLDFSTSGLENPLSHFLIVLFAVRYLAGIHHARALRRLALIACLAALNRLDTLALLGPALAAAAWPHRWWIATRALLVGFLPLIAWTAFSLFYYGFPLPNTVYAKLNTGIPTAELAQQGLHYLFNSLSLDPVTLVVILTALAVPFALKLPGSLPLAAGIALHLVYVVRVGGDFMSGRFMAAPFLMALILLARCPVRFAPQPFALALAALAAVGLFAPYPPLTTTASFYASRGERHGLLDERGITDERAIYYRGTGLMTASRAEPMPGHYMARAGRKARVDGTTVVTRGAIGMFGFFAGPGVHIIDPNGLADAFLARLPAGPGWRIGHFDRRIPMGYEATIRKGGVRLDDPALADYYRKLRLVTTGDLLDGARLRAIWDLNWGRDRALVAPYFRLHSQRQRLRIEALSTPVAVGTDWDAGTRLVSEHGLDVALGSIRTARALEFSADGNDGYSLVGLRDGNTVWEAAVPPNPPAQGGVAVHRVELPAAAAHGYDTVRLLPATGDQRYSVGHLRLIETENAAPPAEPPPAATPEGEEEPK